MASAGAPKHIARIEMAAVPRSSRRVNDMADFASIKATQTAMQINATAKTTLRLCHR